MINFLRKCGLLSKSAEPRFLHTVQRFCSISKVSGLPKSRKKREKSSLRNHGFLRDPKSASKSVFIDSGLIFGLHFGAPERPKIEEFRIRSCFCVRRAFWVVLGPLWAPFWSHFGVILSSCLMDFRRFSVRCPILFERCSGVACSC